MTQKSRKNSKFSTEQSIAYLIRDLTRQFSRTLQKDIAPYGILLGQYHFLRVLWEQDGITQRELAMAVGMKESTTFTALAGMESLELVQRQRDVGDRRKMIVTLTPKGKKLESVLIPLAKAVNNKALQNFSDTETEQLRNLLGKLSHGLHTDDQ
ncbi:MarR family transcriptional regulator [Litorivicinus sp.]|jgi:DNA-binding MarR family transcriptional regulator|nr:MarR family transcriptional regulator [Litorivicinus sp.]MDC1207949.1 MarR family transcriptional regulator [Litorivicinus sp.]MDC1240937.1 MarR family transcriptional regulator [Litorivicinus sp.]